MDLHLHASDRIDVAVRPTAIAFTGCLTVVAVLGALGAPGPAIGFVALAVVAGLCARGAELGQAAAIGAVAWLFDDGFVADALHPGYEPGVLHGGAGALVALGALVAVAVLASASRPSSTPPQRNDMADLLADSMVIGLSLALFAALALFARGVERL